MQQQQNEFTNGAQWDYVRRYEVGEDRFEFRSRPKYHFIFQMPEIVEHVLGFLEEDPIDALYFLEYLTVNVKTLVVHCRKGSTDVDMDNIVSASYIGWLQRMGSYRDYRNSRVGMVKALKAPIYSTENVHFNGLALRCIEEGGFADFTKLQPFKEFGFYEGKMTVLGMPAYFRMFTDHWTQLWKKNNRNQSSEGWSHLRNQSVDYFFYRFGEMFEVFRLDQRFDDNPYKNDKKPAEGVKDWHCVDCCCLLDVEVCSYNSANLYFASGNQSDLSAVASQYQREEKADLDWVSSQGNTLNDMQALGVWNSCCFNRDVKQGNCPFEAGECFCPSRRRNLVKRCLTCINRRWKLLDMYDAWGLIEENFRNVSTYAVEIPEELLVHRLLPDNLKSMSFGTKRVHEEDIKNPREQCIEYGNVKKYIGKVSKAFLITPKKYGLNAADEEEKDAIIKGKVSRGDRVRLAFIMRLLTMLPVKNYFIPDEFYHARMGYTNFKTKETYTAPFLPWPLNISLQFQSSIGLELKARQVRYFGSGSAHYYTRASRGHCMTYMLEEDVRWIIQNAKEHIEETKYETQTRYDFWNDWLNECTRHFFDLRLDDKIRNASKENMLKSLDNLPNFKFTQGGFPVEIRWKHDRPMPYKYRGWFGTQGTLTPDAPFWEEYAPNRCRIPLQDHDSKTLAHMELNRRWREYVESPYQIPEFYEDFVPLATPEWGRRYAVDVKRHIKMYEVYTGRKVTDGYERKMAHLGLNKLSGAEGEYTIIRAQQLGKQSSITEWMEKNRTEGKRAPNLNVMRREMRPSLKKFIKDNEVTVDKMMVDDSFRRRGLTKPALIWKGQLTRIDYCAMKSKLVIDWDRADPISIDWAVIASVYNSILRKIRYHNALLDEDIKRKEKRKRETDDAKKVLQTVLEKKRRKSDTIIDLIERNSSDMTFLTDFIDCLDEQEEEEEEEKKK